MSTWASCQSSTGFATVWKGPINETDFLASSIFPIHNLNPRIGIANIYISVSLNQLVNDTSLLASSIFCYEYRDSPCFGSKYLCIVVGSSIEMTCVHGIIIHYRNNWAQLTWPIGSTYYNHCIGIKSSNKGYNYVGIFFNLWPLNIIWLISYFIQDMICVSKI